MACYPMSSQNRSKMGKAFAKMTTTCPQQVRGNSLLCPLLCRERLLSCPGPSEQRFRRISSNAPSNTLCLRTRRLVMDSPDSEALGKRCMVYYCCMGSLHANNRFHRAHRVVPSSGTISATRPPCCQTPNQTALSLSPSTDNSDTVRVQVERREQGAPKSNALASGNEKAAPLLFQFFSSPQTKKVGR